MAVRQSMIASKTSDLSALRCDVLIAGSGLAGMRAAKDASDLGLKVLWITDGQLCSGSSFYPLTAALGSQCPDSPEDISIYLEEVLDTGCGVADPELVRILIEETPEMVLRLPEIGIHPARLYAGRPSCFAKRERLIYSWGNWDKVRSEASEIFKNQKNLTILKNTDIEKLYVKGGSIAGAILCDEKDQLRYVSAKAVILATGGYCGLYKHSLNTSETTGVGHSIALDAGAGLVNLEFLQFIPGFTKPVYKLLFSETTLRHAISVKNADGEDALQDYLPDEVSFRDCLDDRAMHGPFTTEDKSSYFERAMMEDAKKHHRECGFEIAFDKEIATDTNGFIVKAREMYAPYHIDLAEDKIWLAPFAHCCNGGIRIGKNGETRVHGLFAAGEVSGGVHGADRHGGMATSAALVFGHRAALAASEYLKQKNEQRTENNTLQGEENLSAEVYERTASEKIPETDRQAAFRELEAWIQNKACDGPDGQTQAPTQAQAQTQAQTNAQSNAQTIAQTIAQTGKPGTVKADTAEGFLASQLLLQELAEKLWYTANCERNEKELTELLSWIRVRRSEFSAEDAVSHGDSLKKAMRAFHALRTAEAFVLAMLLRKESRGPHCRSDYPEKNAAWDGVRIEVREAGSGKLVTKRVMNHQANGNFNDECTICK